MNAINTQRELLFLVATLMGYFFPFSVYLYTSSFIQSFTSNLFFRNRTSFVKLYVRKMGAGPFTYVTIKLSKYVQSEYNLNFGR